MAIQELSREEVSAVSGGVSGLLGGVLNLVGGLLEAPLVSTVLSTVTKILGKLNLSL